MTRRQPQSSFAFVAVNLIPMTGKSRALPGQTVIVRDGVISAVGPDAEVEVPPDAVRIEARGKTLLPGLHDMHVHITPVGVDPAAGIPTEAEAVRRAREYLFIYLASGVTTVRNMAGTPLHLRLRTQAREGVFLSPRIYTAGAILETTFTFAAMAAFGRLVKTREEARAAVFEQKRDGYDFIKIYNDLAADIYDEIMIAAREVAMPVIGHVAFAKGLEGALSARQDSIEHLRSYDFAVDVRGATAPRERWAGWLHTTPAKIAEVAEKTAEAGVWNVPTLIVEATLPTDAELADPQREPPDLTGLPRWLAEDLANNTIHTVFTGQQRDAIREGLGARLEMVAALDKAGAGLLAGSDCPTCGLVPGRSLIQELELLVRAGLSPHRALQAATADAARFLGASTGVIAPGKAADLLLLHDDPLEDFTALHRQAGVMLDGRWLPAAQIACRIDEIAASGRAQAELTLC